MKEEWVWQGQERCIHCKTGPWEKEISSVKQQLKTLHQILPSRSFPQMPFCSPAVSLSPNLFHYAHKLLPFGTVFGAAEDVTSERWKALQLAGIHWWGSWQPWPADRTCTWDVAIGRGLSSVVPHGDWLQVRPEPLTAHCFHPAVRWNRGHSMLRAESQLQGNPSIAWTASAGTLVLLV